MSVRTLGLIGSAAGGVEQIRPALIESAIVVYDGLNDPNNHEVIVGNEVYVPISYNYRWVYVKESDLKSV
ncbi:hypothetical protein AB0I53_46010 [Saccharopolyspora sp. NPDC050389]|uniref:hypothetical protein n=1 Tax=Saccharopolyspora sp. NPDC050389 TaxID=3155516 RepID=UPI0033FCAD36